MFCHRFRTILLGLITGVFASSPALASSVFLKPIQESPLSIIETRSVEELIRSSLLDLGETLDGDERRADYSVEAKILRLGLAYILSLSKIKKGQLVFQQQTRVQSIEDLDTGAYRVVRAVVHETKVAGDGRVSDVLEEEESNRLRKTQVVRQWFVGLGPSVGNNLRAGRAGVSGLLGVSWTVDPKAAVRAGFNFGSADDANSTSFTVFNLGVEYFLNDHSSSPHFEFDFGYGGAVTSSGMGVVNSESSPGFVWSGGLGMRLFRTSRVNVGVVARRSYFVARNSIGNPEVTSLYLNIYF